ncbi:MAG: ABC transporter ATP-binding protein [Syntrophotaleaceae bacterium]
MKKPLISVDKLAFSYGEDEAGAIFRDVSFTVSSGDVFCLLGPNGTGKSTLLKCVSNILHGWQGSILLDGRDMSRLKPAEVAKTISYVPQTQASPFPFLVHDIVVMGRAPHLNVFSSPTHKDREIALAALETVGIGHLADRPCTMLSGGEWQLTLIARALAQQPRVMILDEPTSHLDMGNQVRILRVVRSLAEQGIGILMASHFPDHAFIAATEAAILDRGRMVHQGRPDEVVTGENLEQAYGIVVKVLHIGEGVDRKACFPTLLNSGGHVAG